jgi:hypothetical protein
MGQPVPEDDLPGSQVPEDDLPSDERKKSQPLGAVSPGEAIVGAVAPAVTGAAYAAETGLPQLAKGLVDAVGKPALQAAGSYLKNPINVLTDVALTQMGAPPVAGMKKIYDTYQGAKEVASNVGNFLSKVPAETLQQIRPAANYLDTVLPDLASMTKDQIKNFKLPGNLANDAQAVAALREVQNAIPGTMSKIGAGLAPLARGVGRVAGPAGMALNVYDAAQTARETDLGGRLVTGEGQRAQQASTNMLNRNVSGYTPNPQEAQNILASGDERMINMYGGRLKLKGLASPGPNAFNSGFAQQLNTMGR